MARSQTWQDLTRNLFTDLEISPPSSSYSVRTGSIDIESSTAAPSEHLIKSSRRPPLFRYQQEIVDNVIEALPSVGGLLALPTGAGKTRTALTICLEGIHNKIFNNILWLATTSELLDQAHATAEDLFEMHGGLNEIFLSREYNETAPSSEVATITFSTPQAVYQRSQRNAMPNRRIDLVVFDEAHQLGARTFQSAVGSLGCLDATNPTPLLGLSATPGRSAESETEDLVNLFNGRLLTAQSLGLDPIQALEQMGILSKISFKPIPTQNPPGPETRPRLKITYNLCKRLVADKRSHPLVFTPSVASSIALAEVLNATGFRADAIHSGLDIETRRSAIRRFAEGSTDVLTNHRILATGYDCPAVSDVIFVNEVGSAIQFEQMVGRACRGTKTGGSYKSTVWEFDDHRQLHGLPQSYRRYSDFRWE